ncbi:MAG TPA: lysophospholipid acyltransferase family protein [Ktedonobacteraceae bacterium]|nr:lysophospholipid acyltransferase family protein [Ktedonobacteraceae bacterium]
MLYSILKPVFWLLAHILCRFRVSGRQNIPRTGPVLVVSNHLIWYDPILLGVIFPRRLWFMAKIEIFRLPLVGLGCRLTGQIPVHRGESDRAALEMALDYLRKGRALAIFPEGRVARHERLLQAHTGAAMLALRAGVPILPVAHTGTRRIFIGRRAWLPRVDVCIGEPYVPEVPEGLSRKAAFKLVTENLMLRIADMMPDAERGSYAMLTSTPPLEGEREAVQLDRELKETPAAHQPELE